MMGVLQEQLDPEDFEAIESGKGMDINKVIVPAYKKELEKIEAKTRVLTTNSQKS